MPSTTPVLPIDPVPVPRNLVHARHWLLRHVRPHLTIVDAAVRDPGTDPLAATASALDVLRACGAYLACHASGVAPEYEMANEGGLMSCGDPCAEPMDSASSLSYIFAELPETAARMIRSGTLLRTVPRLRCVLDVALCAFIVPDPDLNPVRLRRLRRALAEALASQRPLEAIAVLETLRGWLLPAMNNAPLHPAEHHSEQRAIQRQFAAFVPEIDTMVLIPLKYDDAVIARLEARRAALAAQGGSDEILGLLDARLSELGRGRALLQAHNAGIGRPRLVTDGAGHASDGHRSTT